MVANAQTVSNGTMFNDPCQSVSAYLLVANAHDAVTVWQHRAMP